MKTFLSTGDGRKTPLEDVEEVGVAFGRPAEPTVPVVKKNKGGRPKGSGLKLTPELQDRFCKAVAGGMFLGRAATLCGISLDTFENWCTKGRDGIEPFAAFVTAFEKADVESEAFLLKIVNDAAPKDFRAALAILQRRHAERWSDYAARLAVLGPNGDGITTINTGLSIYLHLGGFPEHTDSSAVSARTARELLDRRKRERDIEAISVLSAPIQDKV